MGMEPVSLPPRAQPSLKPPSFGAFRTIMALILREMESTYGRSPGGYLWAIVQPVGMILLLSLAFSLLVKAPSLGTSFIFFYATGYLPFDFYSAMQGKITAALRYSRPLLAYPSVTWMDAILARFILNFLTSTTLFFIVMTAIILVVDTRAVIDVFPIIVAILMTASLGLGIGLMNCLLSGLWPVWAIIWGILSRPLFLASGVLFLYEDMPREVQDILWWNPLMHVTGLLRTGFFPTYNASYVSLSYGFGWALILIALGFIFLRANYKRVLEQR
tara:strand:- start:244 stop:1065 length:822 start_codon:yes stop_codon:yes gene_type:complete